MVQLLFEIWIQFTIKNDKCYFLLPLDVKFLIEDVNHWTFFSIVQLEKRSEPSGTLKAKGKTLYQENGDIDNLML